MKVGLNHQSLQDRLTSNCTAYRRFRSLLVVAAIGWVVWLLVLVRKEKFSMTVETITPSESTSLSSLEWLINTLDHPETNILELLQTKDSASKTRDELLHTCQYLFQEIETLAQMYQRVGRKDGKQTSETTKENFSTLSGLSELYLGEGIDIETIWGQVDLQNEALRKILKKSVQRLAKASDKVCVLNLQDVLSSDENDDQSSHHGSESEEEVMSDDEDDETKRIRERMERAMDDIEDDDDAEMEGDDEEEENEEDKGKFNSGVSKKKADGDEEESSVDPAAEELNDGFFDIHEMEEFADEEEEYLPDEAFGKPEKQKKKKTTAKKSFHQRQREGDLEGGSDEEDDDDDFDDDAPVRRKKYRDDEQIDALYALYQAPKLYGDNDDDDDDVINMTAADIFGKPKKKYFEKRGKRQKERSTESAVEVSKDDDDSWGMYDFDKEGGADWKEELPSEAGRSGKDYHNAGDEIGGKAGGLDMKKDSSSSKTKGSDNSKHSKQAEKLRQKTEELEKEMLSEKPWQLTGETKATSRPLNSLLEGTPEFKAASKQAPIITVEHTENLEEVIKKRILAEDWDDVVPRELPDVGWHKKRGELPEVSQEKSKLGLGELYEREYLKKVVGYDVDAAEKQTEEEKAKNEMKQLFANLCSKLDALSNYHFAPRPIADEAEVRPVTTPAIAMEEILPLHVSDARGVAPEEVYATKRGREGVLRGETEMDQVSAF